MSDFPTDASETTFGGGGRAGTGGGGSALALDDVFDDPEHGDPGRDRMGVHFGWELFLLLAAGVLGFLVWHRHSELLRGQELRSLLVEIAGLGLVTLGAGLSLRAATPNLAVGPIAIAAAVYFAKNGDDGVVPAIGTAAVVALVVGVALAILVVGVHVPAWAATLAAAFVAIVYIQMQPGPVPVSEGYDPGQHAFYLVGGFVALAALGGLFGAIKTVRRAVGRFRPVADPARRRGALAGTIATVALLTSTVLAAVGGVLIGANLTEVPATTGLEWSGLALGAALIGGTSAFGRRGGVFGTVFAVVLVVLFLRLQDVENWRISWFAVAAVLVVAGLLVTRVVEALGRPQSGEDDEDDDGWTSADTTQPLSGSSWSAPGQDSWSSTLPAQPSTGRGGDLWSDSRWGSRGST